MQEFLSVFGPSLAGILLIAGVHLYIGRLRFLDDPRNGVLDMSAGVAIAYVFVEILPHLSIKQQKLAELMVHPMLGFAEQHSTYLVALAGFTVYLGVELSLQRSSSGPEGKAAGLRGVSPGLLFIAVSLWLYSFFIGYMLAEQPTHRYEPSLLFAVAVSAHFLGLNHIIWQKRPVLYDGAFRLLYAGAALLGWLTGAATEISDAGYAFWFSFLAGGVISCSVAFELPRVKSFQQFVMFCMGAALFSILILWLETLK